MFSFKENGVMTDNEPILMSPNLAQVNISKYPSKFQLTLDKNCLIYKKFMQYRKISNKKRRAFIKYPPFKNEWFRMD
jgi:hypothetical protein